MLNPEFQVVGTGESAGITYECGCPCEPTARPNEDGGPGFEHCCCGKVHFVGAGAEGALSGYLAERKARRTREPEYTRGTASLTLGGRPTEIAWAFPVE